MESYSDKTLIGTAVTYGPVTSVTGLNFVLRTYPINQDLDKDSDVVFDTMKVSGTTEHITDGGMETWASATDLTNWAEALAGTSTINREATSPHGGTYCVRMDIDASNSMPILTAAVTLVPGKYYSLSFWYKTDSLATALVQILDTMGNVYLTDAGAWSASGAYSSLPENLAWTRYQIDFQAHASYTDYYINFASLSAASLSVWFDDASLIDLLEFGGANTLINQSLTTTAGPTFDHLHITADVNAATFSVGANQVVGARAVTQAALKADYTTGDLDTEAEVIAAINATNAGFNTLLAKVKTHGLLASA
jgi:hypothetical protein